DATESDAGRAGGQRVQRPSPERIGYRVLQRRVDDDGRQGVRCRVADGADDRRGGSLRLSNFRNAPEKSNDDGHANQKSHDRVTKRGYPKDPIHPIDPLYLRTSIRPSEVTSSVA